ncbi:MAG TPA: hypothetical protein VMH87_10775 [Pseudomonadales bacterium]|nr:hypothetical protein [Pseudomonadales bacterium]
MPPKIEQFVPLVPTLPSAESREFQISIIPQGEQAQSFQSLQNGAPVVGGQVPHKKHGEPTLSVQRDNGRVTHIKIQCGCGQAIELECVYDEAGKVAPKANVVEAPEAKPSPKTEEASKERKPSKGRK